MADQQIPDQMTAVVLDSYSGIDALRVEQRPVPRPGDNEVLVKVAASPINPSDLSFLEGLYGFKKPTPVVPGFEGAGTVVAAGDLVGDRLNGKRVACISQGEGDGVWAEYMVTSSSLALPLEKTISLEQGAMSVVNPLTAIALLDIAKEGGHKFIVNTAAASALGQMMNRLGAMEGIQVINVVRRDGQSELLEEGGASIVLNSSAPDFDRQLRDVCRQHQVHLAYDAIAGSMTRRLLDALPADSKVTVYGGLSFQPAQALPGHLIFQNKRVDGFWLTSWLRKKSRSESLHIWQRAQKLLPAELKSEVRARYPLQEAKQAVLDYQQQMTGGKVLIGPDYRPDFVPGIGPEG